MSKEMLNYFKGEKEFYEFVLIHMDGKQRADMLMIARFHYSSEKRATDWYNNIKAKITDERAIEKLTQLYNDML